MAVECEMTVERDAKEFDLVRQCYLHTSNINVGSIGKGFGGLVVAKENGIGFFQDSRTDHYGRTRRIRKEGSL